MTTADYEKLGRELLKSYLDTLPGLEISMETTDKYDPVDYFAEFTDFRRCEFEIKTRASKYKDYLTHVLEKEKYNNMIKSKEEHSISFSYYVNFFIGQEIYMYLYNIDIVEKLCIPEVKVDYPWTKVYNTQEKEKTIYNLPVSEAKIFKLTETGWTIMN